MLDSLNILLFLRLFLHAITTWLYERNYAGNLYAYILGLLLIAVLVKN